MAQQAKQLPRHNWRRIYFKILKNLKKNKIISDFKSYISTDTKKVQCFTLYIDHHVSRVNFYQSKYRDEVKIGEDFYDTFSIIIGKSGKPKTIQTLLKKHIKEKSTIRIIGDTNEKIFLEKALKIIDSEITEVVPSQHYSLDDINGKDVKYKYRGVVVPLQLKKSFSAQDTHKKKFPHIPSLVFIPEEFYDLTRFKHVLHTIGHAYTEGRIIHK